MPIPRATAIPPLTVEARPVPGGWTAAVVDAHGRLVEEYRTVGGAHVTKAHALRMGARILTGAPNAR